MTTDGFPIKQLTYLMANSILLKRFYYFLSIAEQEDSLNPNQAKEQKILFSENNCER